MHIHTLGAREETLRYDAEQHMPSGKQEDEVPPEMLAENERLSQVITLGHGFID